MKQSKIIQLVFVGLSVLLLMTACNKNETKDTPMKGKGMSLDFRDDGPQAVSENVAKVAYFLTRNANFIKYVKNDIVYQKYLTSSNVSLEEVTEMQDGDPDAETMKQFLDSHLPANYIEVTNGFLNGQKAYLEQIRREIAPFLSAHNIAENDFIAGLAEAQAVVTTNLTRN